jgi:hypothetical protein
MAVGATFVAKQDGAGFLVGLVLVTEGVSGEGGGETDGCYQGGKIGLHGLDHEDHFLMGGGGAE